MNLGTLKDVKKAIRMARGAMLVVTLSCGHHEYRYESQYKHGQRVNCRQCKRLNVQRGVA